MSSSLYTNFASCPHMLNDPVRPRIRPRFPFGMVPEDVSEGMVASCTLALIKHPQNDLVRVTEPNRNRGGLGRVGGPVFFCVRDPWSGPFWGWGWGVLPPPDPIWIVTS